MIQDFVQAFEKERENIKTKLSQMFSEQEIGCYADLVTFVVKEVINKHCFLRDEPLLSNDSIHTVDDGHYQGTLLFLIPENTYQPYDYWFVRVAYGSCSGCDTLENVLYSGLSDKEAVDELFTLCLHIVQGFKKLGEDQ